MTVYTWLVALLLAAAILFRGNQKDNKKFIYISFGMLFVVMGLRKVTAFGSDAAGAYLILYRNTGVTEWSELSAKGDNNYNIGFTYLMKLIYEITGGNYQIFVTLISLFVVFSYARFIRRYSVSPIQSVLFFLGLLYYTMLFDILKQAVAMAILLFAFDAIIERKPIKFLVFVILATQFHFPALIFLPAYWISRISLGRDSIILLVLLLIITYLFRDRIRNLMLNAYVNEDIEATMAGIRFLRNKAIIMIAIILFAMIVRPPAPEDTVYNALLMFAGVAIILQTFCGYNNIFERLADYYFHTSIVLFPLVFEKDVNTKANKTGGKNIQIINILTILTCAFAIWRFLSTVNYSSIYMPYRFFWQ